MQRQPSYKPFPCPLRPEPCNLQSRVLGPLQVYEQDKAREDLSKLCPAGVTHHSTKIWECATTMPAAHLAKAHAISSKASHTALLNFVSDCSVLSGMTAFKAAWQKRFKAGRFVFSLTYSLSLSLKVSPRKL